MLTAFFIVAVGGQGQWAANWAFRANLLCLNIILKWNIIWHNVIRKQIWLASHLYTVLAGMGPWRNSILYYGYAQLNILLQYRKFKGAFVVNENQELRIFLLLIFFSIFSVAELLRMQYPVLCYMQLTFLWIGTCLCIYQKKYLALSHRLLLSGFVL